MSWMSVPGADPEHGLDLKLQLPSRFGDYLKWNLLLFMLFIPLLT